MSNDWIEWNGGKCPVEEGTLVDVKYLDGEVRSKIPAMRCDIDPPRATNWRHEGGDYDIIAYRLSEVSREELDAGQLADGTKVRELRDYDETLLTDLTMDAPGYERLAQVLMKAYLQAAEGKGKERHANDMPFHEQPMQRVCDMVGPGFAAGQAIKKIQEAMGMLARGDYDPAMRELLGAIVYTAGVIVHQEDQR